MSCIEYLPYLDYVEYGPRPFYPFNKPPDGQALRGRSSFIRIVLLELLAVLLLIREPAYMIVSEHSVQVVSILPPTWVHSFLGGSFDDNSSKQALHFEVLVQET